MHKRLVCLSLLLSLCLILPAQAALSSHLPGPLALEAFSWIDDLIQWIRNHRLASLDSYTWIADLIERIFSHLAS